MCNNLEIKSINLWIFSGWTYNQCFPVLQQLPKIFQHQLTSQTSQASWVPCHHLSPSFWMLQQSLKNLHQTHEDEIWHLAWQAWCDILWLLIKGAGSILDDSKIGLIHTSSWQHHMMKSVTFHDKWEKINAILATKFLFILGPRKQVEIEGLQLLENKILIL